MAFKTVLGQSHIAVNIDVHVRHNSSFNPRNYFFSFYKIPALLSFAYLSHFIHTSSLLNMSHGKVVHPKSGEELDTLLKTNDKLVRSFWDI
jgi:hypothetical protein